MKKKQARNIIILLTILLLLFLGLRNNRKRGWGGVWANSKVPCDSYECGGMQPVGAEPKVCPSYCKCGAEDPMIPDAPRKCEPI